MAAREISRVLRVIAICQVGCHRQTSLTIQSTFVVIIAASSPKTGSSTANNESKAAGLPIFSLQQLGGTSIWNRRGCSSEILNLIPKGDHLGVAQGFCDP